MNNEYWTAPSGQVVSQSALTTLRPLWRLDLHAVRSQNPLFFRKRPIVIRHHPDKIGKPNARLPAKNAPGLRRIALENVHLGRPPVPVINLDELP